MITWVRCEGWLPQHDPGGICGTAAPGAGHSRPQARLRVITRDIGQGWRLVTEAWTANGGKNEDFDVDEVGRVKAAQPTA